MGGGKALTGWIRRAVIFLPLLAAVCISCRADFIGEAETEALLPALPEGQAALVSRARTEAGYDLNSGIRALALNAASALRGIGRTGIAEGAKLLSLCLLGGLASLLLHDHTGIPSSAAAWGTVFAVTAVGVGSVGSVLNSAVEMMNELTVFANALLPSMAAAGVASGTAGASLARQGAAMVVSELLINGLSRWMLPVVYGTLAVRLGGILSKNEFLNRLSAFAKTSLTLFLRTILTLYTVYLTVSGLTGAAADTLAKRAAKVAVTAGVPLVGTALTDAVESVYAGGALLKNTLGVFGMIAVMGCVLVPLISMGVAYLALRCAAALARSGGEIAGCAAVDAIADSVSMVFALCTAVSAMLLVTVIACMQP